MTATPPDETHLLVASMPFAAALGVQLDSDDPQQVRGHLDWSPERCTLGGFLHGGALMTLADSLGAICAYLNLPEQTTTSTIQSTSNFFHGVRQGRVHGISQPLQRGNSIVVVQTDLFDDEERRVAQTTQSQAVLPEPE
ncbi:uncharacterized protein (TIGR00369 family) [Saccharopolyspora lacisalsi]|uniref:Uncharacterized protein (TIGR00369 family) n=1 Tax=Halosaccharopolyspora lacisalsi TaxID=1000566 RepID=A0A839DT63_9PSEU|nr:PaaI family thioesterase [Halosaccharopolyspora lacisalsi]MBA8824694.1 uncharacterized protein (TIGR00369 family) [Halosaccharopolyspora lacisalsi]